MITAGITSISQTGRQRHREDQHLPESHSSFEPRQSASRVSPLNLSGPPHAVGSSWLGRTAGECSWQSTGSCKSSGSGADSGGEEEELQEPARVAEDGRVGRKNGNDHSRIRDPTQAARRGHQDAVGLKVWPAS